MGNVSFREDAFGLDELEKFAGSARDLPVSDPIPEYDIADESWRADTEEENGLSKYLSSFSPRLEKYLAMKWKAVLDEMTEHASTTEEYHLSCLLEVLNETIDSIE